MFSTRIWSYFYIILIPAILVACSQGDDASRIWISDSRVATRDMEAEIVATSYSAYETEVWAQLRDMRIADSDVFVRIYADTLRAASIQDFGAIDKRHDLFDNSQSLTEEIKIMRAQGLFEAEAYAALFAGDYTGNTFSIAMTRGHDQISAPRSYATIPDGFTIQTPLNGSSFMPTTEAITLTWSPAGSADQMSVHIDLRCTDGGLFTSRINISGDPGVYTVMPEEFVLMFPDFQAQCTSYIRLARTRPGELDPAFGGGIVSGRQERRVQLTLIP